MPTAKRTYDDLIAMAMEPGRYAGFEGGEVAGEFDKRELELLAEQSRRRGNRSSVASQHQSTTPADAAAAGEAAPPCWKRQAEKILDDLQIEMMGEVPGTDHIEVFSRFHHKPYLIRDIRRLDYARMLKEFGAPVIQYVSDFGDDSPKPYTQQDVRNAISYCSGFEQVTPESKSGVGCWRGRDEFGHDKQCIMLVGSGEVSLWDGSGELKKYRTPKIEGRKLEFGTGPNWFNHDIMAESLKVCDHEWARAAIKETEEIFGRWRWKNEKQAPTVIAGLIMATWVQSIWDWRPQVGIPGPSKAGKTTLFKVLEKVFGKLTVLSSGSTAAGLLQELQASSKVLLCDEFEVGPHRTQILSMLRQSGRGSTTLKGTPSHKVHKSELRNIAWVAAIEVGLNKEPDQNRFITLELVRGSPDKKRVRFQKPSPAKLYSLGQRLLTVAVKYGCQAAQLAEELKSTSDFPEIDDRVIESFAVPAAMVSVASGMNEAQTNELLRKMLEPLLGEARNTPDEADLLQSILSSIVDVGRGERCSVAQLLDQRGDSATHNLERCGIGIVAGREEPNHDAEEPGAEYLFIAQKPLQETLLKRTDWERQSIETLLRRISGAFPDRRRIAGQRPWGTSIPMAYIESEFTKEIDGSKNSEKNNPSAAQNTEIF